MTPETRPRLRGVSHHIAFYVAVVAGAVLVAATSARSACGVPRASDGACGLIDRHAMVATAIYAVFLAGMFGVSATLHRRDWGPRAFGWLRRADHAMIFACIAGTYTPFCVLGVGGAVGNHLLILAWSAAGLGILRALLWPHAPRAITSVLYVAVGWVVIAYLPEVHAALDPVAFGLLIGGGVAFTAGAVVYGTKWPDPSPTVFGYHEVFHGMIILGCMAHFAAVGRVVLG